MVYVVVPIQWCSVLARSLAPVVVLLAASWKLVAAEVRTGVLHGNWEERGGQCVLHPCS
jgi:hypothetical protein